MNTSTKQFIYKTHRWIGLIILVPTILWVLSGLLHPFMGWFPPNIKHRFLREQPVQPSELKVLLLQIMEQYHLETIQNVRLVRVENMPTYQVHLGEKGIRYFHTGSGKEIPEGDERYAKQLAKGFLGDSATSITSIKLQHEFDGQYREINRLLPVYKVSFFRPDGIEVYVETASSRLGTANDSKRRAMLWLFNTFHNWDLMPEMQGGRLIVIGLMASLIFLSALSGLFIYGIFWRVFKQLPSHNSKQRNRKLHRIVGLSSTVFMFLFAFSGAFHAFKKLEPDSRHLFEPKHSFKSSDFQFPLKTAFAEQTGLNTGLVFMDEQPYYQITKIGKERTPQLVYINAQNGNLLPKGDSIYAVNLACMFSGLQANEINKVSQITAFKGEYGFINKRLPVMRVDFDTPNHLTYYVETRTGKMASHVTDSARLEGFSFAWLHKFHFLDFLGKDTRNILMMCFALTILGTASLGLLIFLQKRKSSKAPVQKQEEQPLEQETV